MLNERDQLTNDEAITVASREVRFINGTPATTLAGAAVKLRILLNDGGGMPPDLATTIRWRSLLRLAGE